MSTNASRSLEFMRKRGYVAEVAEKRLPIPGKFVTRDLFGVCDIVALGVGHLVGVQTTSLPLIKPHMDKYATEGLEMLKAWMKSGAKFEMHGWKKVKNRWKCRVWYATLTPSGVIMWYEEDSDVD